MKLAKTKYRRCYRFNDYQRDKLRQRKSIFSMRLVPLRISKCETMSELLNRFNEWSCGGVFPIKDFIIGLNDPVTMIEDELT